MELHRRQASTDSFFLSIHICSSPRSLKNQPKQLPSRRNPCMPGCGYCGNSPAKRDVPPADQTWTSSADSTRQTDRQADRQTDRHKAPTPETTTTTTTTTIITTDNKRKEESNKEFSQDWYGWTEERRPRTLRAISTRPGPVASPSRVLSFQYLPHPTYLILHHGLPLHNGLWNRGSSKFTLSVSGHQTAGDTFLLLCLGPAAIPLLLAFAFPRSQPHHTYLPCKSLKLMSSFCPFHHALPDRLLHPRNQAADTRNSVDSKLHPVSATKSTTRHWQPPLLIFDISLVPPKHAPDSATRAAADMA
ncbi:hypothetical protein IWZ03DRAFT_88977 [Phyllosticta citriasiana]|uniref:Uncharacterized protein n=1 Tax=Phyllosticta citriasiana TaxID=595635 RepID=A0ABR1KAQ3_9PEZI